jgi:hypothetical protein
MVTRGVLCGGLQVVVVRVVLVVRLGHDLLLDGGPSNGERVVLRHQRERCPKPASSTMKSVSLTSSRALRNSNPMFFNGTKTILQTFQKGPTDRRSQRTQRSRLNTIREKER